MNRPVAAVILAAGSSLRMGGIKKEFQRLNADSNVTVLGSCVCAFSSVPSVEIIVIVVPENTESAARDAIASVNSSALKPRIIFINGGKTRQASVFNALSVLVQYDPGYVLIHDGARPWVSISLIEKIIEAACKHNAVIPLLPVTDTPKECDTSFLSLKSWDDSSVVYIKNHLKRTNTGMAQTPQAFAFSGIFNAHEKASMVNDEDFTDDAEIWGRFCGQVAVIPGERENKKITFPEDLIKSEIGSER